MSYQLDSVLRLHARDLVFFSKSLKEKLTSGGKPKRFVVCNSYPKSGTHLLYQILYSLPELQRWDDIISVQALCGIMNTPSHIQWKLNSAPDSSIIRCHLMHTKEVLHILSRHRCKILFIYRDLRDVAVSHARWVNKEKRIFLNPIYQRLPSFDEQLMSSIKGTPIGSPFGSNLSQPDIGQDFARWRGWLQYPEALSVKFEDLVGDRGGGCEDKRMQKISEIIDHLDISIPQTEIRSRFSSQAMNPKESHTFKKGGQGAIGGWKHYFTDDHRTEFKKVAGHTLIELGYESTLDW